MVGDERVHRPREPVGHDLRFGATGTERRAISLVQRFGSLAGVYEHIEEIEPALQRRLEAGEAGARLAYELLGFRMEVGA